jgi:hypothetical protein
MGGNKQHIEYKDITSKKNKQDENDQNLILICSITVYFRKDFRTPILETPNT